MYFDHFADTDVDLQSKINQFACCQYCDLSAIIWTIIPALFAMHYLLAHRLPVDSSLIMLTDMFYAIQMPRSSFTLWPFKMQRLVIESYQRNGLTRETIIQSQTCTCMICMIVKVSRIVEPYIMMNTTNTINIMIVISIINIVNRLSMMTIKKHTYIIIYSIHI